MRDLNYGLKQLVHASREGSHATRAARQNILQQSANTLHELGFRKLQPTGLKPKHVEALIAHWQSQALSPGTIKNRLSHIRWWAAKVGKPAVVAEWRENKIKDDPVTASNTRGMITFATSGKERRSTG